MWLNLWHSEVTFQEILEVNIGITPNSPQKNRWKIQEQMGIHRKATFHSAQKPHVLCSEADGPYKGKVNRSA